MFLRDAVRGSGFSWPNLGMTAGDLLVLGGPTLPYVGDSVFYFLLCLVLLLGISAVFWFICRRIKFPDLFGYAGVLLGMFYFFWLNLNGIGIPYWRIDNFIIYIPIAFLTRIYSRHECRIVGLSALACCIGFTALDLHLRSGGIFTGLYSRGSVVCGAVSVFLLLRSFEWRCIPSVCSFLATYSLGIFAIHKYWQFPLEAMAYQLPLASDLVLGLVAFMKASVCLGLTCLTVWLVGRSRCAWMVR